MVAKIEKEYKPLQRKKYTDKRYKITRKVFLQSAYIADDIIYVDDYMKDYILNPLFTIESSMYHFYLHSIYDTKDKKYITEIRV